MDAKEMEFVAAANIDFLDEGEISCAMIESVDKEGDFQCTTTSNNASTVVTISSPIPPNTTLLNSSAASHLIKSWEMFHTYSEADARNVTTANLGTLQTHGVGICYMNIMFNGKSVCVKLNNCFHAPDAAMNLLLVS